jgi:high-affinity nickel-transport protein
MITSGAYTVFALGLRHGADPDHLAAIDNLTRNSVRGRSPLSRFVGALFAGGHTVMVLSIAALIGYLGSHFAARSQQIETAGTWISIAVLLLLAAFNMRQLAAGQTDRVAGAKARLLPAFLRNGTSPWLAIPVGLLFGFGFETSSQIAAYAVAFSADAGVAGAMLVGAMFSCGMACTDTLDSVLVHRLVTYRSGKLPRVMRVWIWSVTILALAVAGYELAGLFGAPLAGTELPASAVLAGSLFAVFAWIVLSTRHDRRAGTLVEQLP